MGFGVFMGLEGLRTQPHLPPQCTALWGDPYGVIMVLMGPEGLQTHTEPMLPSLTPHPKVQPQSVTLWGPLLWGLGFL